MIKVENSLKLFDKKITIGKKAHDLLKALI